MLDKTKKIELFNTEFMSSLLEVFWVENKYKIIKRLFLPYIIYLTFTVLYLIYVVCDPWEDIHEPW